MKKRKIKDLYFSRYLIPDTVIFDIEIDAENMTDGALQDAVIFAFKNSVNVLLVNNHNNMEYLINPYDIMQVIEDERKIHPENGN